MKKLALLLISFLVGIGLYIWISKTVGWQEIKNAFLVFTGWKGFIIFILTCLAAIIGNWKWKEILEGEDVRVPFRSLLNPYLSGFAVMFLAPILLWVGEIFRGYVLKKRNSIPWSKGLASVVIDRILEWTTNLAAIFAGVLIFLLTIGFLPSHLTIIFGATFLVFFLGIFFFYFKAFKRESIVKLFLRATGLENFNHSSAFLDIEKEVFAFFKFRKEAMWKALGLNFLRTATTYLRAWFLIFFLGKEISFLPVFSILGFTYLAAMIPIPTSLGSHELIQTFAFNALNLGSSTAAAFTMVIRGAELLIALFGVVVLCRLGLIFLKDSLFKNIDNMGSIEDIEKLADQ